MSTDTTEAIRAILREHGRLAEDVATLCDQSDLFQAGLSSHASVTLMLALEDHFDVEFPEGAFPPPLPMLRPVVQQGSG